MALVRWCDILRKRKILSPNSPPIPHVASPLAGTRDRSNCGEYHEYNNHIFVRKNALGESIRTRWRVLTVGLGLMKNEAKYSEAQIEITAESAIKQFNTRLSSENLYTTPAASKRNESVDISYLSIIYNICINDYLTEN